MKEFLIKLILFIVLALATVFGITKIFSLRTEQKPFNNYDSEVNLFTIKRNTHYDIVFMGISHARNFARFKNQLRVEKILNSSTLNIGRGGGKCGAEAEYVYLKHFYSRGNTADKIIYVPTPPLMFSEYIDVNSSIFEYEPFRASFFFQYLFSKAKNKKQQLYYYLRFKFKSQWAAFKPKSIDSNEQKLAKLDSAAVTSGFKLAYPKGLDSVTFERNKAIVRKTVELCRKHNTQVLFIMTPAMFGSWPGNEEVFRFLEELKKEYPIEIYDYSEVCKDPQMYFDHHHLNSKGVSWFTGKYLKPLLNTH
jgi:hypothetical protein